MLDDLLGYHLKAVFCGTAVGLRSAERKLYYAGRGNKFWEILYQVGLTPRQLEPKEYKELLTYGIGLTDLVKHKAGIDRVLDAADFQIGRQLLREQMLEYQPRYLCFNGKRAAKQFFGKSNVAYGLQDETLGATRIFVAPSTSAAAGRWWDPLKWQELADMIRQEA